MKGKRRRKEEIERRNRGTENGREKAVEFNRGEPKEKKEEKKGNGRRRES